MTKIDKCIVTIKRIVKFFCGKKDAFDFAGMHWLKYDKIWYFILTKILPKFTNVL